MNIVLGICLPFGKAKCSISTLLLSTDWGNGGDE